VFSQNRPAADYLVENLSAGGALLVGDDVLPEGACVVVMLSLPGHRPLRLDAVVTCAQRGTAGARAVAVAFLGPSSRAEDQIQQAALAHLQRKRGRGRAVLLVDDETAVRAALARSLLALRCQVVQAATPLEALERLQEDCRGIGVAIVDLVLGPADGRGLLGYLAEEYPQIRRVAMSGKVSRSELEATRESGYAHIALAKPMQEGDLAAALALAEVRDS